MKMIITEKQCSIEGKGNPELLLALLIKGIEAVILALIQQCHMDITQAGFLVYQCVSTAADEVLEMTEGKNE